MRGIEGVVGVLAVTGRVLVYLSSLIFGLNCLVFFFSCLLRSCFISCDCLHPPFSFSFSSLVFRLITTLSSTLSFHSFPLHFFSFVLVFFFPLILLPHTLLRPCFLPFYSFLIPLRSCFHFYSFLSFMFFFLLSFSYSIPHLHLLALSISCLLFILSSIIYDFP